VISVAALLDVSISVASAPAATSRYKRLWGEVGCRHPLWTTSRYSAASIPALRLLPASLSRVRRTVPQPAAQLGHAEATLRCATLTVPLDHAGLHPGPKLAEQVPLQVAMADNAHAPRGRWSSSPAARVNRKCCSRPWSPASCSIRRCCATTGWSSLTSAAPTAGRCSALNSSRRWVARS
jgi:hypothetical protein